ncbi:PLP-dependent aminotransferase family protein [Myroides sp. DW712]|uniref:aminotransferase-like domain-containing protein n=1 Tax=Myroides sp. DW712 TaxID=3389800 RepID=UPI00397DD0CE
MTQSFTIPYNRLIKLDKTSSTPIYMQIANQLSNAIQRTIIPIDTKLPGSRKLATLLQVNRNTIIAAFDELTTQGWLISLPNQGTFVQQKKSQIQLKSQVFPSVTAYDFPVDNRLDLPNHQHGCTYYFTDGTPDIRLGLQEELAAIFSANLKRKQHSKYFDPYSVKSRLTLAKQVVTYLNVTRNIQVRPTNVLLTQSVSSALSLCTRLLLKAADQVAIDAYSYYGSNIILQQTGAELHRIPFDHDGLDLQALEKLCQHTPIRLLYIRANHQYPTTQSLNIQKRVKLLQLAQRYDFIVIEDDSTFDFHYNNHPPLPLLSGDATGRVIYLTTLGKALASDLSTAVILAPENLISELEKYKALIEENKNYYTTHVLTELIEEGILFRHQVKVNKIYKERRDYFCDMLQQLFADHIEFTIPEGDLAVWVTFRTPVNLMRVRAFCLLRDLYIPTTLLYQSKILTGIRLGFAHLTLEEMDHCLPIFHQASLD